MRNSIKLMINMINECYKNDYEMIVINGSSVMRTYDFTYWESLKHIELNCYCKTYVIDVNNIKDITIDSQYHITIILKNVVKEC